MTRLERALAKAGWRIRVAVRHPKGRRDGSDRTASSKAAAAPKWPFLRIPVLG